MNITSTKPYLGNYILSPLIPRFNPHNISSVLLEFVCYDNGYLYYLIELKISGYMNYKIW